MDYTTDEQKLMIVYNDHKNKKSHSRITTYEKLIFVYENDSFSLVQLVVYF